MSLPISHIENSRIFDSHAGRLTEEPQSMAGLKPLPESHTRCHVAFRGELEDLIM